MAIHNYKGLYYEWGEHMSNTGVKYFRVARIRDRLEWRNGDRYYNKLKKAGIRESV